jgi:hypothetical protein
MHFIRISITNGGFEMKKKLLKSFIIVTLVLTLGLTLTLKSVNADSVYSEYGLDQTELLSEDGEYSLEVMLIYAINDEYLAQAEYQAIIAEFGEIKPFTNIVNAEQTHIDILLPLFETYDIDLPLNNADEYVVLPESITSALATGVEAEEKNIAMYQTFLAQDNLPDDVRSAFEYLLQASEHHLSAFSKDRYQYVGEDMMNQVKNQFRKMFQNKNQNQSNQLGQARGNQSGQCINS